jgi:hypothetical protein
VVSGPAPQRRVIRGWTLGDYATLNSHQSHDGTPCEDKVPNAVITNFTQLSSSHTGCKRAFSNFFSAAAATATQIEIINMIVEHLTHQGVKDAAPLYEQPFAASVPTGSEQPFDEENVTRLFTKIKILNDRAVA